MSTKKDMIDFFSSIDSEETTIVQNPNQFQAQMLTGGNDFQQFQLQLQQQQQLLQMQQMAAQQNMMLQNQFTGMVDNSAFSLQQQQPGMMAAQPTGFNTTNPFAMQLQQQQQDTSFGNNSTGGMMDLMGNNNNNGLGNGLGGGQGMIMPQSTGNPFRLGPSPMGSGAGAVPQMPMMTGVGHFNTMPNLSSQPTGAGTNPFAPSANPLNPFSPNYGKVHAQPTGMMGGNNSMGNNSMGNNSMGNINNAFGNLNMNGDGNGLNNNNNGVNNGVSWQQQQQQQQQQQFGSNSSFM